MTRGAVQLHTIVLNVRAQADVYSAMPIRMLKAVADTDGIPAVLASIEAHGSYLKHVEGADVRIISPQRIDGFAERAAKLGDVLLVDVPVDLDNLAASSPILDQIRNEAELRGIRLFIFTMEGGTLLHSSAVDDDVFMLGRGEVSVLPAFQFDLMLLRFKHRLPCVMRRPDNFLDQPGRPILTYLDDEALGVWMQVSIDHSRRSETVRSILDRP